MRRLVLPVLVLLDVALLAGLALMWFTPQGRPIGVQWTPPPPLRPDLGVAAAMPETGVELGRYVATLERPLFVPSRRPPPPPQAVASAPPAPVASTLPDIRLMAVYGNKDAGGAVARVDGRVRRLKVGDDVGGWTVKDLRASAIDVALADDVRTIELKRRTGNEPDAVAAAGERGPAAPGASTLDAARQREADARRAQTRRMNALRAKLGMAPLPEP